MSEHYIVPVMSAEQFLELLKLRCTEVSRDCRNCCMRLICFMSPTDYTPSVIHHSISFLMDDDNLRKGTGEHSHQDRCTFHDGLQYCHTEGNGT